MQDARQAFESAVYSEAIGIQGFYNTLIDHAQNMTVYPDEYMIRDKFIEGIPTAIRKKIFYNGLSPKVNTIDDFMAEAKSIEASRKTIDHYNRKVLSQTSITTRKLAEDLAPKSVYAPESVHAPWKLGTVSLPKSQAPPGGIFLNRDVRKNPVNGLGQKDKSASTSVCEQP